MLRLAIVMGLSCAAGAAAAQSPESASALRAAAFANGAPVERVVEQKLAGKSGSRVYLFAGAGPAETRLREDPRWTPANDADNASSLVNTKIGVGYRRGGVETSFGYMRRQLRDTQSPYGDGQRKDRMVGFSLKYRPGG